jgi:hypothetical protein
VATLDLRVRTPTAGLPPSRRAWYIINPGCNPGITATLQLVSRPNGSRWYDPAMCRSIRTLRHQDDPATTGEVEAAARQYVRKVSGFRQPSARNTEAFDIAIAEIAAASQRLILAMGGDVEPGPDRKPPARPYRDADHDRAHRLGRPHAHEPAPAAST